jgi:pimeloyl-ACP methyl ester carboxylesterase
MRTLTPKHSITWLALGLLLLASPQIAEAEDGLAPVLKPGAQNEYLKYLNSGFHRAFALSESGHSGWASFRGSTEAATRDALGYCRKFAGDSPCILYSLDGYNVWGKDPQSLPRYAAAPKLGLFLPSDYTPVHGPEAAKGVVIWSHGYMRGFDATQTQPHGYVSRFLADGWDVYRYNREYIDQYQTELYEMMQSIEAARRAGYKKIVLAGHSHGGWISLAALGQGAAVDGVIADAPAHHGAPPSAAARSDFRELLRDIRTRNSAEIPLVIAFFQNDPFDPGGRFADVPDLLGGTAVPVYLIDRPAELPGHGAGNNVRFNDRFGPCIFKFVTASPHAAGQCQ